MILLLDTDVIIDYLRGARIAEMRHALSSHTCAVSAISYAELLAGIPDRETSAQYASLKGFFKHYEIDIVPIDLLIVEKYIDLKHILKKSPIGDFDTFIAASSIVHDVLLYTRNTKHFTTIPDLKLYRP